MAKLRRRIRGANESGRVRLCAGGQRGGGLCRAGGGRARRGAQDHRRRADPGAADGDAARPPDFAGRHRRDRGARSHRGARRRPRHRRDDPPARRRALPVGAWLSSPAGQGARLRGPPPDPQPGHRRRQPGAWRPGGRDTPGRGRARRGAGGGGHRRTAHLPRRRLLRGADGHRHRRRRVPGGGPVPDLGRRRNRHRVPRGRLAQGGFRHRRGGGAARARTAAGAARASPPRWAASRRCRVRLPALEEALAGGRLADGEIEAALACVDAAIEPDDDLHASAAYRRRVARVLLGRAIREARDEARP